MPRWGVVGVCLGMSALLLGVGTNMTWLSIAGGVLAGATAGASLLLALKPRDPYSLDTLREVHERSSWTEAEETEIAAESDVVCPNCGTVYGAVYPVCPSCRCSRLGCG